MAASGSKIHGDVDVHAEGEHRAGTEYAGEHVTVFCVSVCLFARAGMKFALWLFHDMHESVGVVLVVVGSGELSEFNKKKHGST
jgi:hypothetical protein